MNPDETESNSGPEKMLLTFLLIVAIGIAVLWCGSKVMWRSVSIRAADLQSAGQAVLAQYNEPTNGLVFVQELARSSEPDTSTIAFKGTNGEVRYRIDLKRVSRGRWAVMQYDNVGAINGQR